jgi:caa(3)-type oxidase subunit IV
MKRLVVTFIALIVLAGASWMLAELGAPTWVALTIAAVKVVMIGLAFMELSSAHVVPRTIAVALVFFVALLISGTMADVGLR